MKGADKKVFKQCMLDPVEPSLPNPLPDVPEHFNYGVFFDDDFNYMRFLKSASEFRTTYRITGIPENDILDTNEPDPQTFREPECDDEPIPDGLGLESDAEEGESLSELEDNFIELAGGPNVQMDEDEDITPEASLSIHQDTTSLSKAIPKEKVLLMERFLYGDNERDRGAIMETGSDEDDLDKTMDEDDAQFEKMLMHFKKLSKSANQSIISGSSMMSEGLQFALTRDTRMLNNQCMRSDELEDFEPELKEKTLEQSDRLLEKQPIKEESDESEDDDISDVADILSVTDNLPATRPQFHQLAVPTKGKKPPRTRDSICPSPSPSDTPQPSLYIPRRRKGETVEEKRNRKHAVKEQRRERRLVRKTNRENFRMEQERQLSTGARVITIS